MSLVQDGAYPLAIASGSVPFPHVDRLGGLLLNHSFFLAALAAFFMFEVQFATLPIALNK